MLTLSILWVVLAATVPMIATVRKVAIVLQDPGVQTRESGRTLTLLTLLVGFVYISKFLVSSL